MDSPSLKEVDIVELVEFDRELEGGLQVAHGVCEELARARVARRAMPRPLPARATHGGLTASAAHCTHCTALHDHTRPRPGPGTALRLALALCRAGPSGARRPDAAAATDVRLTVREPGIHFLIAASAHARRPLRT